jgi:hypothetical protein
VYGIAVAPASLGRFPAATVTAAEDSTDAVVVQRTGSTAGSATIDWQRVDGTATPDADFTTVAGTITFAPGEQSKPVPLGIVDDAAREPAETIELALGAPTGGLSLGTPFLTTVTIAASDQPAPPSKTDGTGSRGDQTPIVDPPLGPTLPGAPPKGGATDTTDPVLTVRAPRLKASRARRRGVRVRIGGNEPVALRIDLLLGARRLARRSLPLAAGTRTVTLRAGRRQRRRLRAGKVLRVRVAARDAAGNATTRTLRIRLRR